MKVLEEAKKRMLKRKLAGEKGSVTLFVLIAMLFFLTIGVVIFITNMNNSSSQQRDVKKIQSQYNNVGDLDEVYEEQKDRQVGKLVISVIDKYKEIYQSTNQNIDAIWIKDDDNKFDLPLSVNITWPEGISNNAKKVEIEGKILTSKGEGNIKHITIQENNISVKDNDGNYRDVMRIIDNLHTLYEDCDITLTATANEGTSSEVSKSVKIRIDRTKPTINMGSGEVENTIWIDLDKDENAKGTIDSGDVSATDEMSGKKSLRYIFTDENRDENNLEELEGDPRWKDVTGKITQTISHDSENEQDYYIYYRAEDNAGNVEYKKSKKYAVRFANYRIETQGKADQYAMTLQDAINKCSDTGSKIVVIQNVNDDSTVADGVAGINANKNFTLDTNGHTATMTDSIVVASGKTVTFVDNKTGENKGKLVNESKDMLTNNGKVVVDGAILNSVDRVINGGNVEVKSGKVNMTGAKVRTTDYAAIWANKVDVSGGEIVNNIKNYGICFAQSATVTNGKILGKEYAIGFMAGGTLTIENNAQVISDSGYGIVKWGTQNATITMNGGLIKGKTYGIRLYEDNNNVTVKGGTIEGETCGIFARKEAVKNTIVIGDKTQNLSTETPIIKATNGYGINIEDATSSLEFYSGQIIGTKTTKVNGIDVAYSIADASKVTYRTGYGAHTTEESGVYTTTLVEPEFNVNMQNIYLNLKDKTTEEIKVTGRDLGTITYTSQDETKATVTAKDGDNKTGVVTAKAEGTTKVIVKDTNSGLEKEITVYVDNTPPQITKIEPNTTTLWEETEGKVQRQEVTVTIEATDNISGVKTIQYIVDQNAADPAANAEWQTYNDTDKIKINNSKAGEYYIHIKVTDKSGNVTIGKSEKYIVKDVNYTIEKDGNTQLAQTLAEAVDNAQTGSTIKPLKDYTDNSTATINKDVTIDTNGKTLTMANTITVASNTTATFVDTATTKGKLERTTGDLVTNNGNVVVNDLTMSSNKYVINGGNKVTVNSGYLNSSDYAVIIASNITVNNGNIISEKSTGIVSRAVCNIKGGKVEGADMGVCPSNGTLKISGTAEIKGRNRGIGSQAPWHSYTLEMTGGTVIGTNYNGIYSEAQNTNISITGGTITGGRNSIMTEGTNTSVTIAGGTITGATDGISITGANSTLTIDDNTAGVNKTSPKIQGTNGYSVNIEGTGSTFNYNDGLLIGKNHDKTYDGREVTFSAADGVTVTPLSGYKPYTRKNGDYYGTVLEKEVTVTADAGDGAISATDGWTLAQDGKTATKKVLQNTPYGTLPTKDEMERTGYTFRGWNGKNLFNPSDWTINTSGGLWGLNGELLPDGTIHLYGTPNTTGTKGFYLLFYKGGIYDKKSIRSIDVSSINETKCNITGYQELNNRTSIIASINFGNRTEVDLRFNIMIEENASATAYEPYIIESSTIVTQDTSHTLKAVWEANDYIVKFDGDGATSGTMADQSFKYDEEKALTQNAYTRAYTVTYNGEQGTPAKENDTATYQFTNWINKTTSQTYQDKAVVKNLTTEDNGEVTLYAVWNPQAVTLPTATREGYIFNGWYDAATGGSKIGDAGDKYIPEANTTLHAQWRQVHYTITVGTENLVAETMQEAIKLAEDRITGSVTTATITATESYTDNSTANITKNITINIPDGKTITMANTITVENGTTTFTGTGTIQRNVADGVRGDLIRNNGTVVVGVENAENGPTLTSKDVVINNGTVTVYSGNIASQGKSATTDSAGIYSKSINVYGGNITNDSGYYGIVINIDGICNVTGGKVSGRTAICPQNGTLNIGGDAKINGRVSAIGSAAPTHSYKLKVTGGEITGESNNAINATADNTNITITGGTITGAIYGISMTGANSTLTIDDNTAGVNQTSPKIQGTNGYSVNIEGTGSTFNYNDGLLVGKNHDKTYDGREVTFSVGDGVTVTPLTDYKPYTRQNGNYYETVLEKEIAVTAEAGEGAISATDGWTIAENGKTATKKVLQNTPYGTLPTKDEMTREGYTFKDWEHNIYHSNGATISSGNSNYASVMVYYNNHYGTLNPGDYYHIKIKDINFEEGKNDYPTILFYDYTDNKVLNIATALNNLEYTILLTSAADMSHNIALIIYNGQIGNTSGNKIKYSNVDIYRVIENNTIVMSDTDHKIYANWEANPYKVTLNAGNGTINTGDDGWTRAADNKTATKDITYDGAYGTLPTASRPGYNFDGWFTAETGGTQVKADTTMKTASEQTLYPHWTARTDTPYTVKHFKQNIDGTYPSTPADTDNLTGTTDTSVTPERKTYTGFDSPAGQALTIKGDGTAVLEYKYTRKSYTVTYNYSENGGTSATKTTDTKKYEEAIDLTPTATKSGYDFVGWNTDKNAHTALTSKNMPAENVTLYAIYKKDIKITTYQYKNVKAENTATLYNKDANVSVTLPTIAEKKVGDITYTARGWSEATTANGAIAANSGATVQLNASKTYYASYQKEMEATFNYWNGTAAATAKASAIRYMNYNEAYVQSPITTPEVVTKSTGKESTIFTHVSSTKNGAAATVNTATLTYYAVYSKTVKATLKTYNDQSAQKSATAYAYYDGTTLNASIALGTTGNATNSSVEYTPRHWSTSDSADASSSIALNGTASIINDTTYYASYKKDFEATFNYWNGTAKASKKETKTRFMNYKGTLKQSNYDIPAEAKANVGDYTYKHIATGTAANAAAVTPSTANTTYYTVYTRTLTVEYDGNGGRGTTASQTAIQTMNANGAVSSHNFTLQANAFTRNGYTFTKWAEGSASGTQKDAGSTYTFAPAQNASKNVKFFALWSEKTYTLTIKPNGGTLDGSTTDITRNLKYSDVSNINDPTRTGYSFGGYNELSNAAYSNGLASVSVYNNAKNGVVTVTQQAKSSDNPITGMSNEVKITNSGTAAAVPGLGGFLHSKTVTANGKYVHVFVAKLPEGYYFHNAYNSLGTGATTQWLTSNEGTGKWQTYIYQVNAGTGSSLSNFGYIYVSTDKNKVWGSTENSATGAYTAYLAYSNIYDITSDDSGIGQIDGTGVLTANWTAHPYTIHFNANGGTGTMADESMVYDQEKALTKNTFTRNGYTFQGWSQAKEGFENRLIYSSDYEMYPGHNLWGNADSEFSQYADLASYFDRYGTKAKYRLALDIKSAKEGNNTIRAYFQNGQVARYSFNHNINNVSNEWKHVEFDFSVKGPLETETKAMLAFYGVYGTGNKPYVKNVRLYIVPNYTDEEVVKNLTAEKNGEVTLYAQWEPNKYNVVFNKNADNATGTMANQEFTYDVAQNLTANAFSRTGYTFAGWATTATGNVEHTDKKSVKNLTSTNNGTVNLFAKWTANPYKVTLNAGAGTMNEAAGWTRSADKKTSTKEITYDGAYGTLPTASLPGYNFLGWFTETTGGTQVKADTIMQTAGAVSLYPHWEARTDTPYIVKHYQMDLNGNYPTEPTETQNLQGTTDTKVTPEVKTYTGFKSPSAQEITIKGDGTAVVEYRYERNKYNLDLNGWLDGVKSDVITGYGTADIYINGAQERNDTDDYSEKIYYGSTYEIKDIKASDSHKYNSVHTGKLKGTMGTDNIEVVLDFTTQYTITYNLNGGNITGQKTTYDIYTDTFTLPSPTKTNYTFLGWNEEIANMNWYKGFLNLNTGAIENNTTYPNSYYTNTIKLKAGVKYTLSGYGSYAVSNIRMRVYNIDGSYKETISSTNNYTPTTDCYIRILFFSNPTEAQRTGTKLTSTIMTLVEIPKGSQGNRTYTANWAKFTLSESTIYVKTNGTGVIAKEGTADATGAQITYTIEGASQLEFVSENTGIATVSTTDNIAGTVKGVSATDGGKTKIIIKDKTTGVKIGEIEVVIDITPPQWIIELVSIFRGE